MRIHVATELLLNGHILLGWGTSTVEKKFLLRTVTQFSPSYNYDHKATLCMSVSLALFMGKTFLMNFTFCVITRTVYEELHIHVFVKITCICTV